MTKYSEEEFEDFQSLRQEIIKMIIRRSHPDSPDHPTLTQITQFENMLNYFAAQNHPMSNGFHEILITTHAFIEIIQDTKDPVWEETLHPFINP